jgi:uncharacterized protein YndB with AHSA1/START domain
MLGTLTATDDERWEVRFTRHLAHPIEKVWRAITEPEHLTAWFPCTIDGERVAGATLTFRFEAAGVEPFQGEMLAFDPPHLMELRWGDDVLRLELTPDGDGTTLVLTDTIRELGKAARDAAGWHECLALLGHAVAGEAAPFELGAVWSEVHPEYQAAFGPAASTLGPPEGHPLAVDP